MSSRREALELLYGHSPHSPCHSTLLCIRIAFEELIEVACHPLFKNKSLNIDSSLVETLPTNLVTVCKCKLLLNDCRFTPLSIERSTQGMKQMKLTAPFFLGGHFNGGSKLLTMFYISSRGKLGPSIGLKSCSRKGREASVTSGEATLCCF